MEKKWKPLNNMLDIMDELREKLPLGQRQTLESLRKLTIEETYELADAILKMICRR
jgi:XTP/dITP diphosphohydrolase